MLDELEHYPIRTLLLEAADLLALQGSPEVHKDPFDRMLAAQALRHDLTFVTIDEVMLSYGVTVLWN